MLRKTEFYSSIISSLKLRSSHFIKLMEKHKKANYRVVKDSLCKQARVTL